MLPLSVDNVRIRHEDAAASTPDGVTFAVAPGEVVLLLGPSGSGKSTLALALNGLIPHNVQARLEGIVTVNGIDSSSATVAQLSEHVAMVFQDPDSQIVTGTLLDEVCFGTENLLVPTAEVLTRAETALRQVGLWERRAENPDRLSGGGRQRLAIACALALGSELIVLDEPTANLDPVGIVEVYAVLADLVAAKKHAIVLIEHNLDAAIDLVDRVVVIDALGRLALDGPTREIIVGHRDELLALGVWLPVATLAALRLAGSGIVLDPFPLTHVELGAGLSRLDLPRLDAAAPASGTADVVVSVHDLTIVRSGVRILENVSLDVRRGDFLAIVGANGAGKTTLLQAIAGVALAPRGAVTIGGLDPASADVRALAREVGFVFQNPEHQFIRHTVEEELAHGLEIQGVGEGERQERVERMLARFGLTELRAQHPFLLSGGQKRRLSVGTALITGASVLALDEPTFGQDREKAGEMLDLLADLNASGTTVLVVTHDMQLVADYASHVAVLGRGRLVTAGPAADVLAGEALEQAGLLAPPLAQAMRMIEGRPDWQRIARMADLP